MDNVQTKYHSEIQTSCGGLLDCNALKMKTVWLSIPTSTCDVTTHKTYIDNIPQ